jgi:phage-related protein
VVERPLAWIGSTYDDLKALPRPVQREFGIALRIAQLKQTPRSARLRHAVYVLHVFQKKSKHGRELPRPDRALIESRLRRAEQVDREGSAR